eukprot:scaffold126250_cov44-Prasinocladus_malaysianus.AAC.1
MAWEVTKRRSKPMSQEEVDMLFDFFDFEHTGKVEVQAMAAIYEKLSEQTNLSVRPGIPPLVELLNQKTNKHGWGCEEKELRLARQNLQFHDDYY